MALVEAKVLARVKTRLGATAALTAIVPAARIFDSHISTVGEPVYPAVSLALLPSAPVAWNPDVTNMTLQVDVWVRADEQPKSKLYEIYEAIRGALHRWSGDDGTVAILQMLEIVSGAVLFEADTRLWHMARRYSVTAK